MLRKGKKSTKKSPGKIKFNFNCVLRFVICTLYPQKIYLPWLAHQNIQMVMKVQIGSHLFNIIFSPLRFKIHIFSLLFVHPDSFSLFDDDDDIPGDGMNELEPHSTLSPDPQELQSRDVGPQDSGILSSTTSSLTGTTTEATGTRYLHDWFQGKDFVAINSSPSLRIQSFHLKELFLFSPWNMISVFSHTLNICNLLYLLAFC